MDFEEKRWATMIAAEERAAEKDIANARISPLDGDFLLILFFAISFDIIVAIIAIFDALVITWIFRALISIVPFLVILLWSISRTGNLSKVKEKVNDKINEVKKIVEQQKQILAEKQAGKVAAKGAGKAATKGAGKAVAKKSVVKATGKTAVKKGVAAVGLTNFPVIGIIPFYTIWVLSTLKEK